MGKSKQYRVVLAVLALAVLVIMIFIIMWAGKKRDNVEVVGFIMSGGITETGWNGMHYQGVKNACDELGLELVVEENVAEFSGECNEAIKRLAEEGAGMIILSSYGYSGEVRELVRKYPDIAFYANSSEYHEENMTSYFVRMYQARYLAGVLAGMQTENNRIGYVAAMPNNEVNRGISAFTMGVKRVNPEAEVVVAWTGEWDDREKETEAANALIEQEQVDLLTYHQNQEHVIEAAEAAGVQSIGYHESMEGYSPKYLTSVVCNWELAYAELVEEYLRGNGNTQKNYWIGMELGVVGLSAYSEGVSEEAKAEIEKAKAEILAGKEIFSGVIYDIDGILRCGENEIISDEMLLEHFDWYVEGVRFYEDKTDRE